MITKHYFRVQNTLLPRSEPLWEHLFKQWKHLSNRWF